MKHPAFAAVLAVCLAWVPGATHAHLPNVPGASGNALPVSKVTDRASMQSMQISSHGALMNALVYVAAGAGPHPVVILLHGFPG